MSTISTITCGRGLKAIAYNMYYWSYLASRLFGLATFLPPPHSCSALSSRSLHVDYVRPTIAGVGARSKSNFRVKGQRKLKVPSLIGHQSRLWGGTPTLLRLASSSGLQAVTEPTPIEHPLQGGSCNKLTLGGLGIFPFCRGVEHLFRGHRELAEDLLVCWSCGDGKAVFPSC
ncbi:uncharacterized protein LOC130931863 isoform X4 [Corythoichthys intestinalis]|uniref:uncharacterized protein LOC130931863 isoform X4 n=1 Tax=Corythoichthys intestinalis TaxID=161448 RepID=UPI0025A59BDE|nr:uncharacterized protein LOC130931863 isoform X4 [Corythoichthys intestinalis]